MLDFNTVISEYNTPIDLIKMLEALDIITLNHSIRVYEICKIVENELNLHDRKLSEAGLYHDIGKYFITTKLLNKRGKLNKIERAVIDSHSYLSYKILKFYNIEDDICKIALYHHNFKPNIYFDTDIDLLSTNDEVKKLSKILKTIDIYEALTADRSYHRGYSSNIAIKMILNTVPDCDISTLQVIEKHSIELE